jgi:hypothetical protein
MTARLAAGLYSVTVSKNSFQVVQSVKVNRLKTAVYTINPSGAYSVEPVVNKSAFSLSIGGGLLNFIDYDSGKLNFLSEDGLINPSGTEVEFSSIDWVRPGFGLGQDASNRLYKVDGGSIQELKLPEEGDFSTKLISTAGDKDNIFISDGKLIFRGDYGGGYKLIYRSDAEKMVLRSNGDLLLFLEIEDFKEGLNPQAKAKIIDSSDRVKDVGQGADDIEISSSGKLFSLSTGKSIVIVDDNLKRIRTLPAVASTKMKWLSDTSLLFSKEDSLWLYDSVTQRSSLIANMPLASLILEIAIDDEEAYAYLSVSDPGSSNGSIKRVGLKGQVSNPVLIELQNILPYTVDGCEVNLVNFSRPIITATPIFTAQSCEDKAKLDLTSRLIDLSGLEFRHVELTDNE